jgi:hypothetical protein
MTNEQKTKLEEITKLCSANSKTAWQAKNEKLSDAWESLGARAASVKFTGESGYDNYVEFVTSLLDPDNCSSMRREIATVIIAML